MQKCTQILKIIPQTLFDLSLLYLSSSLSTFKMQKHVSVFSICYFIIFLNVYVYMFVYTCSCVGAYTCVQVCIQVQDPLICLPSNGNKDSHYACPALMWVLGM